MMMMLQTGVECSAKIAMRTLRAYGTRQVYCWISITRDAFFFPVAMHIFRSQAFIPHDTVIDTAMEQRMVNA
jgi:hypothetical protein